MVELAPSRRYFHRYLVKSLNYTFIRFSLEIKYIRILLFYASNLIQNISKILKFASGKIFEERMAEIGKW